MKLDLEPGKYVVAVSGGVDSVVLLHILAQDNKLELTVAHFDHGIREDSAADRQFVAGLAKQYNLPFYHEAGRLGPKTSEATARESRYRFLQKIREKTKSQAIVTAHHQDDLIETVFINLLRGTERKGLSSLSSNDKIKRPLLDMTKSQLINYAYAHDLGWREDSTNQNTDYLRNYLRAKILPNLSRTDRIRLLKILRPMDRSNTEIDELIGQILPIRENDSLDRAWFTALPHAVAREVLSHWLRARDIGFDRPAIERLVVGLKTLPAGARSDVSGGWYFALDQMNIRLRRRSSV